MTITRWGSLPLSGGRPDILTWGVPAILTIFRSSRGTGGVFLCFAVVDTVGFRRLSGTLTLVVNLGVIAVAGDADRDRAPPAGTTGGL